MEGSATPQLEDFRRAAGALVDLIAAKAARVLVGPGSFQVLWEPPVAIRFEVSFQHSESTAILERHGLDRSKFETFLPDIAQLLTAAVTDESPEGIAEFRQRGDEGEREDRAVTVEKYRTVEQTFPLGELRARAWAKRTSKNDLPLGLSWEVGRKLFDSRAGSAPPHRAATYATLKIATGPPQHDIFFALGRRGYREMTITVDREDIVTFRDQLNALLERVDDVEKTVPDQERS